MAAPRITLARLSDPPDTAQLERCSAYETTRAVSTISVRLLRRRARLETCRATAASFQTALSGLRRLANPGLGAYRAPGGIVLSEPFGALPSVLVTAPFAQAWSTVAGLLGRSPPRALVEVLAKFGSQALQRAHDAGVRITIVPADRAFSQCSRSVASLVPDIDRWTAPPAGLFVVEERLLLLRPNALRMAAAHEFAHALDAVLATRPRSYFSFESPAVREAFAKATGFVNEYAASGLDEYFAESLRAYVEVNDDRSSWLPLTRYDLRQRDPRMFAIIEQLFASR